jgi:hypothetical protein
MTCPEGDLTKYFALSLNLVLRCRLLNHHPNLCNLGGEVHLSFGVESDVALEPKTESKVDKHFDSVSQIDALSPDFQNIAVSTDFRVLVSLLVKPSISLLVRVIQKAETGRLIPKAARSVKVRVPKLFHYSVHNFGVHQLVSIHRLHVGHSANFKDIFGEHLSFDF